MPAEHRRLSKEASGVKVVVLCGGLGTRLREETEFRPKPMVEVGGRPILWHIMKNYFSICLGQKSHIRYHGNHGEQGFSVTLADTGLECMTGGRIRKVEKYVDREPFLLTYGDGVSDVDIRSLVDFHKSHGRIATVTTVPPISRFGMEELGPT